MTVVPDASVLLKWVLRTDDEGGRDRAAALKQAWLEERIELVVPSLWVYEIGNVLGLKQPRTAPALLAAMVDLQLPEASPAEYRDRIFTLMASHAVTFYDAAYHALAAERRGTMVTADRKYLTRARQAGHLALLDDWPG